VITYGTFDLLHVGHVLMLRRLRELGTRLVVGVSTDEFNALKGKHCSFGYADRATIVAALRDVDEVFPEHTWEQKRDDVIRHRAAIFGIGDDWRGRFDSLSDLCRVVYLPRTPGISTTQIRTELQGARG
jgi:glycerol-3-phosphate cytidylyltransferase